MKQLKFMLAAATAIGLATAAQADVNTYLVGTGADAKENFNDAELGAAATSLTGYSYAGATAADNESVVVTNGYNGTQSLQVNTRTDPIVRDMNADLGNDIDMTAEGFKSLTIDTMVQFTVTPAGDTVTNTLSDKLMIYLAEVTNETGVVTGTNLMVKALMFQPESAPGVGDGFATPVTINTGINTIEPGEWYRLVVSSSATDLGDGTYLPVFTIKVGETDVTSGDVCLATDGNYTKFPSLQGAVEKPTLRYVGFAGEGMVDDLLVFRTDEGATSVDFTFTLAWDEAGFSSVTYTIDDGEPVTPENGGSFTVADGKKLAIAYTLKEWYKISGTPVLEYTAAVNGTDSLTLKAEKVITTESTVDGTVTVNPSATADELAAVKAEAGITSGAFKDSDAEELGKALTWQKKNSVSGTDVSAVAFDSDGNPAVENGVTNVAAQAYLLNCPVDATTIKTVVAPQFKFTAISFVNGKPVYNVSGSWTDNSENVYNFNGEPAFQGATTLGQWHAVDADGKIPGKDEGTTVLPSFFKATLINK